MLCRTLGVCGRLEDDVANGCCVETSWFVVGRAEKMTRNKSHCSSEDFFSLRMTFAMTARFLSMQPTQTLSCFMGALIASRVDSLSYDKLFSAVGAVCGHAAYFDSTKRVQTVT
jgi:hypothetical protein